MNFSMVRYIVGWLMLLCSALMMLPMIVGIIYGEKATIGFLISGLIALAIGFLVRMKKPKNTRIDSKEGLILVSISWIVISLIGSIPFIVTESIKSPVDAIFETVSGFTTTGASILNDVEALPKSIIFWRSFTHWIGGMGILVFVLAVFPLTGSNYMSIMKAESPGPKVGKLVPKVQSTAKMLYIMYISLTILEILLLLITGMPFFDSLCLSFGTAGTGGFGIRNDSIASYKIIHQVIIGIFMILFGVNFNVYFLLWNKKIKEAVKCEELRNYLTVIVVAIIVIFASVHGIYKDAWLALKDIFFTVASIITTTGYATADFDTWPQLAKAILVTIMFIGACAGSTGGGIKVSRCFIMLKTVLKEVHAYLYPNNIEKIRYEGKVVEHNVLRTINVFVMTYISFFIISFLLVSVDNYSFTSNFTAVTSAINNIGPGLEEVGPTCNFSHYSIPAKIVLTIDMLAGRLEIFPILMLFVPRAWKKF